MRRLRLVFALLAAVLLAPLFLLVQRALESTAVERSVRHAAVAERAFDEMERELGLALRREEERPFEGYTAVESPQAGAPAPPWVVGYFQIDPDGRFRGTSTGLEARKKDLAASNLEALVRRGLRLAPSPEPASAAAVAPLRFQAPGTSRRVEQKKEKGAVEAFALDALESADEEVAEESGRADAYKVIASLNRARTEREARPKKSSAGIGSIMSSAGPTAELSDDALAPPPRQYAARQRSASEFRDADEAIVPEIAVREGVAALEARSSVGSLFGEGAVAGQAAPSAAPAEEPAARADVVRPAARMLESPEAAKPPADALAAKPPANAQAPKPPPSVEAEPMVGRVVDPERLLLARTVLVGEQGYRQGLVVDVPALADWLDDAVLGGSELAASAGRTFFLEGQRPPEAEPGRYVFLHRFAEPFDALGLQLALARLPEARGTAYLYAIAALLLLSGAGGLFALYRMVVVRVRFAERRSNFVAAVTHELRTPLTAIRMYGEMLRDGMVDSEEKRSEYYATITAESERLTRLINNVLEFSRLEQGTRDMTWVVGPIGPVIEEAARLLAPHARETGFEIRVAVDPGLPPVRYDRDAVLQVVFNLVDNALKYAREAGDRVIDVRAARRGEGVEVSVRDRGPGVPARHRSRVFEPFYRAEDELTRRAKGTGIGLALVKGLADRMGAAVSGREPADGGFEVALSFRAATQG